MQNVNDMARLRAALTEMEGVGVGACWTSGAQSLPAALAKFSETPEADRHEIVGWYETIYGNGGWHRYFLNLATGEVTFSGHHTSGPDATRKAETLGFALH